MGGRSQAACKLGDRRAGRRHPWRSSSSAPDLCLLQDRKLSPLERGGTLKGAAAAGKDASEKFKTMAEGETGSAGPVLQVGRVFWQRKWAQPH